MLGARVQLPESFVSACAQGQLAEASHCFCFSSMQASTHDVCDVSVDVTDVVPDRGRLRLP